MIVLGVDPGLTIVGYGILESQGKKVLVRGFGTLATSGDDPLSARLKRIHSSIQDIIKKFEPDALACETVFYSRNARSTILLGHARGAVLLAAESCGVRVVEISPREVKSAVVGRGSSSKSQVRYMVKAQLALQDLPESTDVSDALAVALCCLHREFDPIRKVCRGETEARGAAREIKSDMLS
jgi:crossover junction endodeoxyribonuclease RuvC